MEMQVLNFSMRSHLNMANCGILTHAGTIECPEHILHGKQIFRTVVTPKNRKSGNWGKGKVTFGVQDDKREFETFEKLREAFNLPPLKKEEPQKP